MIEIGFKISGGDTASDAAAGYHAQIGWMNAEFLDSCSQSGRYERRSRIVDRNFSVTGCMQRGRVGWMIGMGLVQGYRCCLGHAFSIFFRSLDVAKGAANGICLVD